MSDISNTISGATRSKVVWGALIVAVFGVVQANEEALKPFIPQKYFGLLDIVLGVGIIVARFFTNQSLAAKGAAANESTNN